MNKLSRVFVMIFVGISISLPTMALADFTLSGATGYHWQNDPPTPGPIDRIDTFIYDGTYEFSTVADTNGNVGAISFSNQNFTATLVNPYWTSATSSEPFSGNMQWNYNFAGTYNLSIPLTLAINYYNGEDFVVAEKYTWSGSWSGETSYTTPYAPVPLPASALLLGTGILGISLLGFRRRRS